jgi:radical SAM protein with 4Fe4S-binding SPASM domain
MGRPTTIRGNENSACCYRLINGEGIRVLWEVTARCNLSCRHCVASQPDASKRELSTERALSLIDEMGNLGVGKIMFSGGEPLLRRDLYDLIRHASQKEILVDLITNATRIDERVVATLKEVGVTECTVSLDGSTPGSHDSFRRVEGAFQKTVLGIKHLVEGGIPVDLSTVPNPWNYQEVPEMIDLAYSLGCSSICFVGLMFLGRARENRGELLLTPEQLAFLEKAIAKKRVEYENVFPIRSTRLVREAPLDPCFAGKSILGIDHQGNLHPCPILKSPPEEGFNLNHRSMEEVLHSDFFTEIRDGPPASQTCDSDCSLWDRCGKGCRGLARSYSGSLFSPDPLCSKHQKDS